MLRFDWKALQGTEDLYPQMLKRTICEEECAELIQAISKVSRDKFFTPDSVIDSNESLEHRQNEIEEIADVLLCIEMLKDYEHISDDEIQSWIDYKQKRQLKRDLNLMKNDPELGINNDIYYDYCIERLKGLNDSTTDSSNNLD